MKLRHYLIATGLGLGFSPIAPGTVGSLGGCLIAVLINHYSAFPNGVLAFLIILFLFLGVDSSNKLETIWGKDPSRIVIDEVVGIWISMFMLPAGWIYTVAAIVLFRFFDIYKPLFIRKLESIDGGWGIMLDDVLAGIYANIVIQLFIILNRELLWLT